MTATIKTLIAAILVNLAEARALWQLGSDHSDDIA